MEQLNLFNQEIWKDIEDYESLYQVSDMGRVKSLRRTVNSCYNSTKTVGERILKPNLDKDGYFFVRLCKEGKDKCLRVSRLVALAFIPNPDNLPLVDHRNGNNQDNRKENLRWCTNRQNQSFDNIKRPMAKTSKYIGVHWCKTWKKWKTQIVVNNKKTGLGTFKNEEDAGDCYLNALEKLSL